MRTKSIIVGIFFGLLLLLGISNVSDYGIPWDESIQRSYGTDVYNYIFNIDDHLFKNKDRYYGPVLEFSQVALEKTLKLTDIRDIYIARHMFNYTIFLLGVFFFFLLIQKRFRSTWWALLGSSLLALSPRIFAHAFYNSKDVGFMSLFMIATYFAVKFADNKGYFTAVVAGMAAGLLIDVRIMGLLLPFLLIDVFFVNGFAKKDRKYLWVYLVSIAIFVIVFWPTLWTGPVENFVAAFEQMQNYPQKTSIMYFGERVSSLAVPWHYVLGWVGVTTPVSILMVFLFGLWYFVENIPKVTREDLMMGGWLVIPLVAVILFRSTLYDGWRQMFFIYPPIVYFATYALVKARGRYKAFFLAALTMNMFLVGVFMIRNHPYQNMYFNEFVKPPYESKFELDYWGLAYKEGIEFVAKRDARPEIKVAVENLPGENNINMLKEEDRQRIKITKDKSTADYYITNYRKYKDLYHEPALFTVEVGGTRILGVHAQNKKDR